MSAPLIQHIADSLNCSEAEARSRLEDTLRELKQHVRSGDEVSLPDLGTFTMENDRLVFVPDDSLSRQVNHRFAGLTPVSVSQSGSGTAPKAPAPTEESEPEPAEDPPPEAEPAPADTPSDSEELTKDEPAPGDEWHPPESDDAHHPLGPKETPPFEEPEHTVLDEDEDEEEPEPSSESPQAPAPLQPKSKHEAESKPAEELPDDEANEAIEDQAAGEQAEAPESEVSDKKSPDEAQEDDALSAWPAEDEKDPSEASDTPEPVSTESRAPERRRHDRDRSSGAGILIGLFVLIAVVAVGGYLLQQQGVFGPADAGDATPARTPQAPADSEPATATDPQTDDDESAPAASENQPSETQPSEATAGESETQGADESPEAQPPTIDRTAGGYTIVIASRGNRDQAAAVVEQYEAALADENLPLAILTGESNGQTRYRVGVGQFPSIDAATETRDQLADRLPEGAWVLRIRPNS